MNHFSPAAIEVPLEMVANKTRGSCGAEDPSLESEEAYVEEFL